MSEISTLPLGDSYKALAASIKQQLAGQYAIQHIARDSVLLHQGELQRFGYLILEGVVAAIHDNVEGGQKCKEFYFKDEFVLLFANWLTNTEAFYQLKVINRATVIAVPLSVLAQPKWQTIKQQLITQQLTFKEAKEAFLLLNTPEQRYRYLLAEKPHWLAQLSLTQVAMYIGVSAISLSRIRKRLNLS
jgi:CRP-like cAMP-binding protein